MLDHQLRVAKIRVHVGRAEAYCGIPQQRFEPGVLFRRRSKSEVTDQFIERCVPRRPPFEFRRTRAAPWLLARCAEAEVNRPGNRGGPLG